MVKGGRTFCLYVRASRIDGLQIYLFLNCCRVSLVNSAIVAYFIDDLQIKQHFNLFKKLLFMEDGEFSLSLSNQLFEKVPDNLFSLRYIEQQSNNAGRCLLGSRFHLNSRALGFQQG